MSLLDTKVALIKASVENDALQREGLLLHSDHHTRDGEGCLSSFIAQISQADTPQKMQLSSCESLVNYSKCLMLLLGPCLLNGGPEVLSAISLGCMVFG